MRPPRGLFVACVLALTAAAEGRSAGLEQLAGWKGHENRVSCLAFSPDGKTLATGSLSRTADRRGRRGEIKLWDVAGGKKLSTLRGHETNVCCLAFSPDGKRLASVAEGESVRVWDVASAKSVFTFGKLSRQAGSVAFARGGKTVVAAGDHGAWVWDAADGKELASSEWRRGRAWFTVISPDGSLVALPFFQDLDLWEAQTGKLRRFLPDHRGQVSHASFSPDGKTVAVASYRAEGHDRYSSEVKLWDVATGKERAAFASPVGFLRLALYSPDGKALALMGRPELYGPTDLLLFDLKAAKVVARRRFRFEEAPWSVAFRSDGKALATGHPDGQVNVWAITPAEE
jgi:WD40 repeat protein